ncbi:hypothetical protein MQE23_24525 [Streptomyces sp. HP-A2021]|uniref:hypothetical protein n=1 Tax=Streptomyces sp. HP-A2021 TaxID=2927875 RepID=UPI001FAEBAC9|nr:hypothetical protein [Streptomyces sp. HP-A2021]UOB12031.1 hypothetical protein MQE23_24525 [Streptomyces sp. HP-A2021]
MTMLEDLPLWRLRAIERAVLSGTFWSEREREIHVHPIKSVMERDTPEAKEFKGALTRLGTPTDGIIELILPITELPIIPILDLSITVAEKEVYRISRDESARIQASYVLKLAEDAGRLEKPEPRYLLDFLTFMFYFPSHPYEEIFTQLPLSSGSWIKASQRAYLRSVRGLVPGVDECYSAWRGIADRIDDDMVKRYALKDPVSGPQCPLITIPYFFQEMRARAACDSRLEVPEAADITKLLDYVTRVLVAADSAAQLGDHAARRFVSTYFTYGDRWMVFARCKVPYGDSFIIKVKEKRAIYFSPHRHGRHKLREVLRKEAYQLLAFHDAETNHINIRVSDTAVRMNHPKVLDGRAKKFDRQKFKLDQEKTTFEFHIREDSHRERPDRIFIKCPLRLTRLHSSMLWLTMAITGFAIALLVNRGGADLSALIDPSKAYPARGENLTAKDATLILVPVAFAASLLLARDTSTLSSWLRQIRQSILTVALFALLVTAFVLIAIHHIKVG